MVPFHSWLEQGVKGVPLLCVHGNYKLFCTGHPLCPYILVTVLLLPVPCRRERSGKMVLARCANARGLGSLATSLLAHRVQQPP